MKPTGAERAPSEIRTRRHAPGGSKPANKSPVQRGPTQHRTPSALATIVLSVLRRLLQSLLYRVARWFATPLVGAVKK